MHRTQATSIFLGVAFLVLATLAFGHGVATDDAAFLKERSGVHFWPYFYLGAKHMVTGYDHLLYLAGVLFYLYGLREVAAYVTLFAIGHSLTLIAGVWFDIPANMYIVDAIIGFSVIYKAFENLGGFDNVSWQLNPKLAVWIFGLCHGLGLATKLIDLEVAEDGLLENLLAFNLGVEVGQLAALTGLLAITQLWRYRASFSSQAVLANSFIMTAGVVFTAYQLTGYVVSS